MNNRPTVTLRGLPFAGYNSGYVRTSVRLSSLTSDPVRLESLTDVLAGALGR